MTDVKIDRESVEDALASLWLTPESVDFYKTVQEQTYALLDAKEAAEAERDRMREVLKPFDSVAGVLFARNYNASDIIFDGGPTSYECLFFGDFLALRVALQKDTDND